MIKTAHIAAAVILAAAFAGAQTTDYGSLRDSHRVVTNEQDLVALQALATEATVRSNATVVLTTNLAAEASSRAALGTSLSNAVAVALTNWTAALAMVAQASSNYAAAVAASVAGATNAAHLAALDPHGDRSYAGGLLATGTAARAADAARLVQIDTQAWVTVASGTATLWRVETVAGSNLSIQAQNGLNPDWGLTNGTILVKTGGDGTNAFYGAGQGNLYRVFFSHGAPTNYWCALTLDLFSYWSAQNSSSPTGHYAPFGAFPGVGTVDLAWVPSTIQVPVTNAYPLAQSSDLPSLAPYATAAQLSVVSNLVAQAQATANTALTNVPSLDQVTTAGSTTDNGVSINASHTRTNTYGGLVSILGRRVQSGYGTSATGLYSHAEGYGVSAGGMESHAEGYGTIANGVNSHAEGDTTVASGAASHAEGNGNTASGANSHAEGNNATASGSAAHAEGVATTASAGYSHAAGYWCKSTNSAAWVWSSGWNKPTYYISHGNNTFNVDPTGGVAGFYIGETNLDAYLALRTSFQDGTNIAAAVLSKVSTNNATVGGWLVWDTGSNVWRKVTCSNLSFFVESVP